jgi:3-phytase
MKQLLLISFTLVFFSNCTQRTEQKQTIDSANIIFPTITTERVKHDSDDPAIWIDPMDSSHVIIVGTDKGGDTGDGGLYAYNLFGKIIDSVRPLKRPNNVDIAYGLQLDGKSVDIAVCTERLANSIRVFSLPNLEAIDNGGIPVFETEVDSMRDPMGIALYTNPLDKKIYAIVGRKTGPTDGTYLWQYLLEDDGKGQVTANLKRKFGFFSGKKEIESIAVDNELGYVYYSDERYGIHKSYAHHDSSNVELALFGRSGFTSDSEGISIYKMDDGTGYILVSDQQASKFRVFPREGSMGNSHEHAEIAEVSLRITKSDGSDLTSRNLPGFPHGLFVAMSDDGTFQFYKWEDLAGTSLRKK